MAKEEDQEPTSLAAAAPADDGDLKRGVSFPEHIVDKRPAAAHRSSSFGQARAPRPPHELRRRHTNLGHKEQQQKRVLKSHSSRGPGVGFLHRLKTSFRLELEKQKQRGPSLARLASGWSESPHPFPDGGVELPKPPRFDPESSEAKRLCVPGTGWRHRLLLVSASCVGFGGYFARNILSAVSADVRRRGCVSHMSRFSRGVRYSNPISPLIERFHHQLIVDFGMTRETYGALSGLPAIPNIVFGPLGGVVTDWIGAGASSIDFVSRPSFSLTKESRLRPKLCTHHRHHHQKQTSPPCSTRSSWCWAARSPPSPSPSGPPISSASPKSCSASGGARSGRRKRCVKYGRSFFGKIVDGMYIRIRNLTASPETKKTGVPEAGDGPR